MTSDDIENMLDKLLPPANKFPTMEQHEIRHIVRAYIITGSQVKAAELLGIANRTLRTRLQKYFKNADLRHLNPSAGTALVPDRKIGSPEPDMTYPCHRDFQFWDWYNNQDSVRGTGFSRPGGEQRTRNTQPRKGQEEDHAP